MSDHVPIEPSLALDPAVRHVETRLRVTDPQLRLRRSIERRGFYVLERRARRSKVIATSRRLTDRAVQARDGYVHVTTVHPWWLQHPDRILATLSDEGADLHRVGFDRVDRDLRQADADARAQRRARRYDHFASIAAEAYDVRQRLGHEGVGKYRINNAGVVPQWPSTGENPAQESTDEHAPGTSHRPEDGGVHDQPAA